jgi:hypothetical protein
MSEIGGKINENMSLPSPAVKPERHTVVIPVEGIVGWHIGVLLVYVTRALNPRTLGFGFQVLCDRINKQNTDSKQYIPYCSMGIPLVPNVSALM